MLNKEEHRKDELLKKAYQLGFELEKTYGNCAQCVLLAVQETLGLRNDLVFKAATGFAGGMGLMGLSACGALSGGILAIGQKFGRERHNLTDPERFRFKTYKLTKKLHERFIAEYGSSTCHDIQQRIFGRSYNLWDPEEYKQFEEAGAHRDKCPEVVGEAAKWVVELLFEEE
ncbi:MAG: C-GCAxxG-C-C family protein [Candidatus Heimdallarchaeota archaeon]